MILDASALLALLQAEPGAATVRAALPRAAISTANLSEVLTKLMQAGVPADVAEKVVLGFDLDEIAVDQQI